MVQQGPPPFEIDTSRPSGRLHVLPRGELDLATAPELEQALRGTLERGEEAVLDMRELEFCDSSGIRAILLLTEAARSAGGKLLVVKPPKDGPVERVMIVSGIEHALDLVEPG
jgi:anti-sigma B factor antagonist